MQQSTIPETLSEEIAELEAKLLNDEAARKMSAELSKIDRRILAQKKEQLALFSVLEGGSVLL